MVESMDIGIRMPPCRRVDVLADFARQVEAAGFDTLYIPDSQTLWRDAYLTLYAAALNTGSLHLTTAVSNVVTRHPTVIAGLARSIDEVAPGRFTLGLGTGHSSVEPIGMPPSRRSELRESVAQIRRLIQGDEVSYGEGRARIRDPRPDGVPIQIAATGPRNLRLAGEIGDGAILLSGVAEHPLRQSIAHIRAGAVEAGRDPESVSVTVCSHAMVSNDVERDARVLKPVVATIAQKGGRASLQALGIDVQVPDAVPEVSPDLIHAEDWDLAIEVSSRWISDADAVAFAQGFCLFGTPEEIVDRLTLVRGLGVRAVFLQHVGSWDLPHQLIEAVGRSVIPLLRER